MFQIEECTVSTIREAFENNTLTSEQLILMYLDRIAKYDKSGPSLNSVLEINPDALATARAMDRLRASGKVLSPLHGIPVILKDNINTCDKMHTSAGSLALADNYAPYDAHLVTKLRKAGMVILGKANMTELANYMSYTMKSGYSSRGGQVINPYKNGAEVWGSSTGSAVAVSANLCALAVGTETNGSVISPSFINGSVGIKPTMGLVSRTGIIPICVSQDTAGPMGRTVEDVAALLNIIVGSDEKDPETWFHEDQIPEDYTSFLSADGLKGLRIGVNWDGATEDNRLMPFTADHRQLALNAMKDLERGGAKVIDHIDFCTYPPDQKVELHEFKQCLNAYLSTTAPNQPVRTLQDMVDFYSRHQKEGLKYGMSILLDALYNSSGTLTEPEYVQAKMECIEKSRDQLDKVFRENDLDLLMSPMLSGLAPVSGWPSLTVPAGYLPDGVPYGLILIARPFEEGKLIAAGYAFEQLTKHRKAPKW